MAPKQKQLDLDFFFSISKEEREKDVEREFANLDTRLEKEHAIAKEKEIKEGASCRATSTYFTSNETNKEKG
jgi:hypothetical protein